jgi:pimeloyl-ACP methyl ester carboxylesterase
MQPSLIIWGVKDQVFPMELAHRLQRYVSLMLPSEFSDKMFQQSTPQLVVLNTNTILSRHLGDNSRIVVIKKAGHAVNLEKDKDISEIVRPIKLLLSLGYELAIDNRRRNINS